MKEKSTCPNCGSKLRRRLTPQRTISFRFCDVCGLKIENKKNSPNLAVQKVEFERARRGENMSEMSMCPNCGGVKSTTKHIPAKGFEETKKVSASEYFVQTVRTCDDCGYTLVWNYKDLTPKTEITAPALTLYSDFSFYKEVIDP